MYPIYYAIITIICLVALIGTIIVAKEMTKQEKKGAGQDEVASLKNESNYSSSISLLGIIYSITGVITIILIWIFIF